MLSHGHGDTQNSIPASRTWEEEVARREQARARRRENESVGVRLKTGRLKMGEERQSLEEWVKVKAARAAAGEEEKGDVVKRKRGRPKKSDMVVEGEG